MNQLYSVRDVSIMFGVSTQRIYRKIKYGKIKAINVNEGTKKIRTHYRIPKEEVNRIKKMSKEEFMIFFEKFKWNT